MKRSYRGYFLLTRALVAIILTAIWIWGRWRMETRPYALAQGPSAIDWTQPQMVSEEGVLSWFPDLAVDHIGKLHAVWGSIRPQDETGTSSIAQVTYTLMHRIWDGQRWSAPNDVFALSGAGGGILRETVAADITGNLYATHSLGGQVVFMKAPAVESLSAPAWTEPRRVSGDMAYMSDLAVDEQGNIHVIYDQWVPVEVSANDGTSPDQLSDLFYRRSEDGGQTWSSPTNLSNSPVGVTRGQIKIDNSGTIYVTWDEGWDRWAGHGEPSRGVLVFSTDGGQTWSDPSIFSYPDNKNAQLVAGSDGQGVILVAWQAWSREIVYYTWSTDGGHSWAPPDEIPGFTATGLSLYDAYDMAVDSAGNFHLIAVGRELPESNRLGVYHLVWDGTSWGKPTQVYTAPGGSAYADPHYPKIVIGRGNRLYAVWWAGDFSADAARFRRIWFSTARLDTPESPLPPTPTPTPTPTEVPAPIPIPVLSTPISASLESTSISSDFDPNAIYTENDDVLLLLISLIPAASIIIGVVLARRSRRRE